MSLSEQFSAHIAYLQNGYSAALAKASYDAVVLHAGRGLKQRSVDDQYWPLKVNPSFAHWLPLLEQDAFVLVVPGKRPTLVRPAETSFWEGPAPLPGDHFWDSFEVVSVTKDVMKEQLPKGRVAFIGDAQQAADALGIAADHCNPSALMARLDEIRSIKSAYEVACLTEATRTAIAGHVAVDSEFHRASQSELDLHLRYLQATKQDSTETPYGNIVAFGTNAAILHHVHYGREVDAAEDLSLLVDAGATYMGYASDITRTTVRGTSEAAKDFRALITGLDAVQLELAAAVVPGLAYEELHNRSHQALAGLLIESGICSGSPEAVLEAGVTRALFPHGLGHSLGLQVHDVGCRLVPPSDNNPFLRNTSTIAEGQVFTLEPGCYFIEAFLAPLRESKAQSIISWSQVDALSPFGGIRIEDNLVVTATSSTNLTRDIWSSKH